MEETFTYRLSIFKEPEEDSDYGEMLHGLSATQGFVSFSLPFEADEDILLETALEQVGIYSVAGYSLASAMGGGFLVLDRMGEAILGLELDLRDDDDPEGNGYYDPSWHDQYDRLEDLEGDGR